MTKDLNNKLNSDGVEETPQVLHTRYKVLHIPTASFITTWNEKERRFVLAIFPNKAKAGHARDDYRNQKFNVRTYSGNGLFLEDDVREFAKSGGSRHSMWQLAAVIKKAFSKHGTFHKDEFELLEVEELDATNTSVGTSTIRS